MEMGTYHIKRLIRRLRLKPHPEGGYYRETYRAAGRIPGRGGRRFSTAILFLLPAGAVSRLHRIKSDEVWHFHLGGPLTLIELGPRPGRVRRTRLGSNLARGELLQHAVKAGVWFGAYPEPGTRYALVGCTVAPGFEFRDLELGRRADLMGRFPRSRQVINRLCP